MPIVTLTSRRRWHPAWPAPFLTERQRLVRLFGRELPKLLTDEAALLSLHPEVRQTGVQVDFRRLSRHAVHSSDVWVRLEFTEVLTVEQRTQSITTLMKIFGEWFEDKSRQPGIVVDTFYGPSHGCIIRSTDLESEAEPEPPAVWW